MLHFKVTDLVRDEIGDILLTDLVKERLRMCNIEKTDSCVLLKKRIELY